MATPNKSPEAAPEKPKAGSEQVNPAVQKNTEAVQKSTKDAVNETTKGAEKPDGKEKPEGAAAKPAAKPETAASAPAASNVRVNSAEPNPEPPKPGEEGIFKKIWGNKVPLALGGTLAGLGTSVANIPLIGKIPFLPQAAGWLQSTISSGASALGLNTGTAATNSIMAALPNWAGAATGGALAIPTALYGIGLAKGLITGHRYGGFWNHVNEGAGVFYEPVVAAYRGVMGLRENAPKWAAHALGTVGGWAASGFRKAAGAIGTVAKPTGWGIGGAAIGAGLLAPFTGGSSLITGAVGYGLMNYLKHKGYLGGGGSGTSAAPHG